MHMKFNIFSILWTWLGRGETMAPQGSHFSANFNKTSLLLVHFYWSWSFLHTIADRRQVGAKKEKFTCIRQHPLASYNGKVEGMFSWSSSVFTSMSYILKVIGMPNKEKNTRKSTYVKYNHVAIVPTSQDQKLWLCPIILWTVIKDHM